MVAKKGLARVLPIVSVLALAAAGCASNPAGAAISPAAQSPQAGADAAGLPVSFTQKVLVEELTGAWCGWCPHGAQALHAVLDAGGGAVIGVALHVQDPHAVAATADFLKGVGGVPGYPSAFVNRSRFASAGGALAIWRDEWASAVARARRGRPSCGLRLHSRVDGAQVRVAVSAGFNAPPAGEVRLAVMITEDNVAEAAQRNFSNDDGQSPFYRKGDPIPGYRHMRVLRAFLTPVFGEGLDTARIAPGAAIERTYSWTVPPSVKAADLRIVGVLSTFGPKPEDKKVLNVQETQPGQVGSWN
jgi:hypothetical protein